MNRLTITKTTPVTAIVVVVRWSIMTQLDAIGVKVHGLRKWNSSDPSTRITRTMATIMIATPARWTGFGLHQTSPVDLPRWVMALFWAARLYSHLQACVKNCDAEQHRKVNER